MAVHAPRGSRAACRRLIAIALLATAPLGNALAETELKLVIQSAAPSPAATLAAGLEHAIGSAKAPHVVVQPSTRPEAPGSAYADIMAGHGELAIVAIDDIVEDIPAVELFSLPFAFRDESMLQAFAARTSEMRTKLELTMLNGLGLRVLMWQPADWAEIVALDGAVVEPGHIVGKQMRVPGATAARWIKECGGMPVPAADGTQKALYQSRSAPLGLAGHEEMAAFEMWSTMRSITQSGILLSLSMLVIREDVWQRMSETDRAALSAAAGDAEKALWDELATQEEIHLASVAAAGLQNIVMSPEVIDDWKYCSSALLDTYADRAGELGQELLGVYRQLLVKTLSGSP